MLDLNGFAVISNLNLDHDNIAIAEIEDTSNLVFSATDNSSTIVESGENILAFLHNSAL